MINGTRWRTSGFALFLIGMLVLSGRAQSPQGESEDVPGILPSGLGEAVDRDVAKVRAATKRFKQLQNAVAAGYERHVTQCLENPPEGGMGFHHQNAALMDAGIQVDRPEILVYERMADGQYKLNGVEYIVPISEWRRDAPPTVMGQPLKRAPRLGIWYLHVWVWEPNPSGLFADWNPNVKCS